MRSNLLRWALVGVAVAWMAPATVWAEFPSEVVGFNGPPIDDDTAWEMFRIPQFSSTTNRHIVANVEGTYVNNNAFRNKATGIDDDGDPAPVPVDTQPENRQAGL